MEDGRNARHIMVIDGRFQYGTIAVALTIILAGVLLFAGLGILATHRIAGPVYRIEVDIERVLAGEKGVHVHTRKRDAFPDLAERVNELIERIDKSRKG